MEPAKTVCIACPANIRTGKANIPASEYDPAVHTLFDEQSTAPANNPVEWTEPVLATTFKFDAVAGGPGSGCDIAPAVDVEIPAGWQALHWKQRVALAEKLTGEVGLSPAEGQTQGDAADAVIAAEIARRASAA